MKRLLIIVLLSCTALSMQAQFELKINPVTSVFGSVDVQGEYLVNENFGVELSLQPFFWKTNGLIDSSHSSADKKSGFAEKLRFKYYFDPFNGADQSYLDAFMTHFSVVYTNYSNEKLSIINEINKESYVGMGLEYGRKTAFDSGLIFEYAIGFGAHLYDNHIITDGNNQVVYEGEYAPLFVSGKLVIGYRFGDF